MSITGNFIKYFRNSIFVATLFDSVQLKKVHLLKFLGTKTRFVKRWKFPENFIFQNPKNQKQQTCFSRNELNTQKILVT